MHSVPSLAILGGPALRNRPFLRWPIFAEADRAALLQTFESGEWGGYGAAVPKFEAEFAKAHDSLHGITTANGTLSLEAALIACGVGPEDEVIVPPISFVATATAVLRVGAIPVFADIDSRAYNLDLSNASAAITPRTKAIIPVHLAGHPADMDALMPLAARHGLAVIEDCAHAHGASWKSRKVGSFGNFGSFSFQQSKNMTAGEGGILVTSDSRLAELAWSYGNQGRSPHGAWYRHDRLGTNLRLTGLQSALLSAQLRRLPMQLTQRAKNAARLRAGLGADSILCAPEFDPRVTGHGLHLFVMRLNAQRYPELSRDRVAEALIAEGITGVSCYPYPLYRNKLFQNHGHRLLPCPNAEQMARECLWLTNDVLLGNAEDVDDVLSAIAKVTEFAEELLAANMERDQ
jgi:dTDP-4-amino-4,6-dideoxygalactose transaminase